MGAIDTLPVDQQLEAIYLGYFGRAADGGGFAFWEGQYANAITAGQSVDQALVNIANSFEPQPETVALYPFLANPAIVVGSQGSAIVTADLVGLIDNIYMNLFARTPPAGDPGVAYWLGQLQTGAVPLGQVILDIANGATGADVTTLQGKITAADFFTTQTSAAGLGLTLPLSSSFHAAAVAADTDVTAGGSTTASEAATTAFITTTPPSVVTLTAAVTTYSGGPNTTFLAPLSSANFDFVNTLQTGDSITAVGTGNSLVATINDAQGVIEPVLKGIQTLTITPTITGSGGAGAGAAGPVTVDLSLSDTSISSINITNPSNQGILNINNVQSAPTAISVNNDLATNTKGAINISIAASALTATTTNTLTLNGDAVGLGITIAAAGTLTAGTGYLTETINSVGSVPNTPGTLTIVGEKAYVVEGSANLTFADGNTSTTSVNAGTTGNVFTGTLNYTAAIGDTNTLTLTGGSGNSNVFAISRATPTTGIASDVINGGTGTGETLSLTDAQAISITAADANISNVDILVLMTAMAGTVNVQDFGKSAVELDFFANSAIATGSVVNFASSTTAAPDTLNLSNDTLAAAATLTVNVAAASTNVLDIVAGSATVSGAVGDFTAKATSVSLFVGPETINLTGGAGGGQVETFGVFSLNPTVGAGALNISGADSFNFNGVVTAGTINGSGLTGTAFLDIGAFAAGASITSGTATNTTAITGSTAGADILVGGGGSPDVITAGGGTGIFLANHGNALTTTEGDTIVMGSGFNTVGIMGDAGDGVPNAAYGTATHVEGFIVGASATTTDTIVLSAANYTTGAMSNGAGAAIAAGAAPVIQTIAHSAGAVAANATANIFELTTGVAASAVSIGATFNAAIGTTTVTPAAGAHNYIVLLDDTTNSRMDILDVTTGAGGKIAAGDTVHLIGTVDITAANYAKIAALHFGLFVA